MFIRWKTRNSATLLMFRIFLKPCAALSPSIWPHPLGVAPAARRHLREWHDDRSGQNMFVLKLPHLNTQNSERQPKWPFNHQIHVIFKESSGRKAPNVRGTEDPNSEASFGKKSWVLDFLAPTLSLLTLRNRNLWTPLCSTLMSIGFNWAVSKTIRNFY